MTLGGPYRDTLEDGKHLLLLLGIELRFFGCSLRTLVAIRSDTRSMHKVRDHVEHPHKRVE